MLWKHLISNIWALHDPIRAGDLFYRWWIISRGCSVTSTPTLSLKKRFVLTRLHLLTQTCFAQRLNIKFNLWVLVVFSVWPHCFQALRWKNYFLISFSSVTYTPCAEGTGSHCGLNWKTLGRTIHTPEIMVWVYRRAPYLSPNFTRQTF